VSGLTVQEIGHRLKPPRSEDWVASRVAETRRTLAANVLEVAGDELPAELRARHIGLTSGANGVLAPDSSAWPSRS
jgi:hypothetical protein